MSIQTKMTAIADEIRILSGTSETMGLDAMATNLSDANNEVDSQTTLIAQIREALTGKGIGDSSTVLQDKTVTPTTDTQTVTADFGYDALNSVTIDAMPTAAQATPSILVDSSGLITATATQTCGYVVSGTTSATKQLAFQAAKTITPTTADQIAVSSGYYTGGVITVKGDSNLLAKNIKSGVSIFGVTGTLEESSSEVENSFDLEDAFITRNLSGAYENSRVSSVGDYIFYGCSKLTSVSFPYASSIGIEAFMGCYSLYSVNFPVCSNISHSAFAFCSSLTSIDLPACKSLYGSVFYSCTSLTSVNLPVCSYIHGSDFYYCKSLTSVNLPVCTSIGPCGLMYSPLTSIDLPACHTICSNVFYSCKSLTSVNLPVCTSIGSRAFHNCVSLTSISFPKLLKIYSSAFNCCYNLFSLVLGASTVCTLSNSNAFLSTPIGGYSASAGTYGSIYVPASLLTSYQTATNWTYFSSRFSTIESLG